MRTFSLLKGLPIIVQNSGSKIGEVADLNISTTGKVKGLLFKKGALFKRTYFIPVEKVLALGPDGVMIDEEDVSSIDEQSLEYTFESKQKLAGKAIMSREGEKLGYLEDVYFLEELGTIVGYECSDGFFSDITEGKRVVKTGEPPTIGKDTIIVTIDESK